MTRCRDFGSARFPLVVWVGRRGCAAEFQRLAEVALSSVYLSANNRNGLLRPRMRRSSIWGCGGENIVRRQRTPNPLSVNSPTGSTVTASLTAMKTRGLIRI
jgi:hypothetical protein